MDDLNKIWSWNATVPVSNASPIHEVFAETAEAKPHELAICAHDGDWTYKELNDKSTKLAQYLVANGVGKGDIVPICFEKSKYTAVAALAVMKSGAASVLLDPSQPKERLLSITSQISASTIICSRLQMALVLQVVSHETIITTLTDDTLDAICAPHSETQLPKVSASDRLYVIFTSGTTGTPKGAIISHLNYATAILHQRDAHGFTPRSRVYDFSSYAFDVSWSNLIHTLTVGACLLIPSDSDRKNDLAGSILRLRATHVDITPSIARVLPDSVLERIDVLVLGGEKLTAEHGRRWSKLVKQLKNPYGPSECTPTATITTLDPDAEYSGSIGRGLGLNTWIVNAEDTNALVPIGETGELLLEGPLVGDGYLDATKNIDAFVTDPEFLASGAPSGAYPGRRGRLYKTGDLVRYEKETGNVIFIGRKDTQVKINGQRVELGDVEHHIRQALPTSAIEDVAAEMIQPSNSETKVLVAFFAMNKNLNSDKHPFDLNQTLATITEGLEDRLLVSLPPYMIPTVFIPLAEFPLSQTGKTDRKQIQSIAQSMDLVTRARVGTPCGTRRAPSTARQVALRELWSSVLGIDESTLSIDDSFVRLGGDSIAAMKLAAAARECGFNVTVSDIFFYPKLEHMAEVLRDALPLSNELAYTPLSLLKNIGEDESALDEAANLCGIAPYDIEDILPCTPLQEGLMSLSMKRDGEYIVSYLLKLQPRVNLSRLCRAWATVASNNPILRTRITNLSSQGLVQVVLRHSDEVKYDNMPDLEELAKEKTQFGMATSLAKFVLATSSGDGGGVYFLWHLHHAIYDGWSVKLMIEQLEKAYMTESGERTLVSSFHPFIKYISDINKEDAETFWKKQSAGIETQTFPSLPSPAYEPEADSSHEFTIDKLQWPVAGGTAPSTLRAALALLMSLYTDASDAVFGAVTSGRQAPLPQIERLVVPTIATVPVRVNVDRKQDVETFLANIQKQSLQMIEFEQNGLHNIRHLSSDAAQLCNFQTLLVVQPAEDVDENNSIVFVDASADLHAGDVSGAVALGTYALTIECLLEANAVSIRVMFDSHVISKQEIECFAGQYEHIVRQLCEANNMNRQLADIQIVSQDDLREIWNWNNTVPKSYNVCVHHLIEQTAYRQPDAPAVCAWDGDFSYAELNAIATRLALQLTTLHVAGTIMPILFEKSKWTAVAMLAVIKAGAAFVALDASQPEDRLRTIVAQVNATAIVSSAYNSALARKLSSAETFILDSQSVSALQHCTGQLPTGDPSNPLYLIFTSGSTGTPKGVVISHTNFSSAILHQQEAHGFEPNSRVYDFASYAFDVSVSNFFHTLTIGACLCVPSEEDRRDDLAGSLMRFQVTHADLTPSTATVLPETTLRSLKTLVLGGEKLSPENARHWSSLVTVKNPYGPSECTPTATLQHVTPDDAFTASIGKGLGLNTWVADSATGQKLVPIGAVGELLLEGPLVGLGYFGDETKTRAAFVENVAFLAQGGPGKSGRAGRLYKTGDLVRYNADGSLCFIGRKDAQVKINGQRVELSDIESHIAHHGNTRQASCAYPKSGLCAHKVIGFFSLSALNDLPSENEVELLLSSAHKDAAISHIDELEIQLRESLPAYMIPSVWVPLKSLPLSTSGKLDSKRLSQWIEKADEATILSLSTFVGTSASWREPVTEMEQILRSACSAILNISLVAVNLNKSFIANGGDSISAMRLSAHCRAANATFSVARLLKSKSLAAFAADGMQMATVMPTSFIEEESKLFHLSPIQQWFFEQAPYAGDSTKTAWCNQGFYLRLSRQISSEEMTRALDSLVRHHSMLRSRFQRVEGRWMQLILPNGIKNNFWYSHRHESNLDAISNLTIRRHQELNPETGPVFSADLCTVGDDATCTYLILVAHHLVVDLVSWRIILEDLETLLSHGKPLSSMPFQTWTELQAAHASSLSPETVLSTTNIVNNIEFWQLPLNRTNSVEEHDVRTVQVSKDISSYLLTGANDALNTEPVEILMAGVWHAFFATFENRGELTMFSEGHGREPWSMDIDISRTVGWFTSISPINLPQSIATAKLGLVRYIKDARRRLQGNGWAYFASRYLSEQGKEAFRSHGSIMEMTFNYHGQFQQLEKEDAFFSNVTLHGVQEQGPHLPASSLFGIEVSINDGMAMFSVSANRYIAHQNKIKAWIDAIPVSLTAICKALEVYNGPSQTLCDYPFLSLDHQGLETLQTTISPALELANDSKIQTILPCTPTVDGILISQIKDPKSYKTMQRFRIASESPDILSLKSLADAWQEVVARQPGLRTAFVPSLDSTSAFYQVVLEKHVANVMIMDGGAANEASAAVLLDHLESAEYPENCPPHRVILCRISSNVVVCQMEMSHAITDGASTQILQRDWVDAYTNNLRTTNLAATTETFAQVLSLTSKSLKDAYWRAKLEGVAPCTFPPISHNLNHAHSIASICEINGSLLRTIEAHCAKLSITVASFLQTAWAVGLAAYTTTHSVVFGYLASGRDVPIAGMDEIVGAYTNMLICRVDIDREASINSLLRAVHDQNMEDLDYQHSSLATVQHELTSSSDNSLFNSIVSYQHQNDSISDNASGFLSITTLDGEDPTEYDIVANISHGESNIEILLDHKSEYLSKSQAERFLSLLLKICSVLTSEHGTIQDFELVSDEDAAQIWQWNKTLPATSNRCVHDLIKETTLSQPKATAIEAWDGSFSYEALDKLTTQMAMKLVQLGVVNGHVVPLCVEKSRWTAVLMLGVMKAGAASVVLDSSQPEDRLRVIVDQTNSPVILCSRRSHILAKSLARPGASALPVDEEFFTSTVENPSPLPKVSPADNLYVVFTSGSTGVPKGVVVTHANLASAILHQRSGLQFDKESRIFDFSSYMFDVAWCNILQGLSAGSCICLPADEDRKADFMSAITRFNANSLILTPSALRGHNLAALDALKSLHFIGEPLRSETFASVHPSVSVNNLYGPTECTTFSTMLQVSGRDEKYISIGVGSGLNTWVVDSTTGSSLVPIGVTGELLLEGPLVSAGYLGDNVKTNLAFVETPKFLNYFGRTGRLYKTGDLVRYGADGALEFMGRKDAQVKINGIRVELGDIESSVKSCLIQDFKNVEVVTEVVTPQGTSNAMLIAFVCFGNHLTQEMDADTLESFMHEATKDLRNILAARVAAHMIPSAYVPLHEVPCTASGKIDRRHLREIAKSLSWEQLLSTAAKDRRMPRTPMEYQLQALWSKVLDVDPTLIGADDNFLHIGGDSVGAMRLVGAAREVGATISVADILRHPKLSEMALLIGNESSEVESALEPFSLLQPFDVALQKMIDEAAMACNVPSSEVEDMYPCTALQEGLLALTARRSGDYIIRCALELRDECDLSRFKEAWDAVVNTTPALRTRIVDITGKGLTQVSVKYQSKWSAEMPTTSLNKYTESDEKEEFSLGSPLARHALLTANGTTYFMLTLHHAIYDGWSLNLVFDRLEKAYERQDLANRNDFRSFVKHVQSIDKLACEKFWATQLYGSEAQAFPALPSSSHQPKSDVRIVHDIESINWEQSDVTPSSKIRAALAILASTYMSSPDVIYGATTTGRQVAVPGIESIIGPTIATVPVHISVPPAAKVSQFLATVQEQAIEMINYEQTGLQNIRRLHATAERLCNFQTLLIVQPADESAKWRSKVVARDAYESGSSDDNAPQESDTYALTLECLLHENGIKIKMSFDSAVMDELQSWRFLRQLEHVLRQLSHPKPEQRVGDISCVSEQDTRDIWKWNKSVPDTVKKCVHELIMEICRQQPTSQAVCAWDGDWSYAELDELSTILGHQLIDQGILTGHIIPLLFEKSKWMPVAMLAVMKAGAASVAVDTSQPTDRLRSIINQVQAPVILCSQSKQELAFSLSDAKTVVLGHSSMRLGSAMVAARSLPFVSPGSLLYLVFTSGSTGTPKGVMVTHSNFTSAIKHQKIAQGILPTSRVFDFASYAFDVAWANPILTFEVGATLCIPSDSDRKDDLNGAISRLRPTHADLTPSAALVLSDDSLNTLHSLTLGGERLAASSAEHWATFPTLTVKNSYGPSECTPTSTFTEAITTGNAQNNSIGQAYGLNTWVADAATGQYLVPIGGVGELLLEGPLLGNGYLGDPEKTDAAFISNPKFLLNGPAGQQRSGRAYRTGDIVKYNSDGSVAFVGRKDAQVKINGQRVELSEIESHVGRFEATHQCVIVFPTKGPCAKRLVCIVQFKDIDVDDGFSVGGVQLVASEHDEAVNSHLAMLQEQLQVSLPRYMIPSIWITATRLPMTASGKQDRRSVNNWVTEMSPEVFARIDQSENEAVAREPATEMEHIIRDSCCSVLNVQHEKLNLDRSFIANGGDSISAMRLASQLRILGIAFSVAELLQSKTLEDFALSAKRNSFTSKIYDESFGTLFPLSPIQQWYFAQNPPFQTDRTEAFYNQGFYVKVTQEIPADEIIGAIAKLVDCHSMLRARFQQQDDGTWKQRLLPPSTDAYHVELASYSSLDAIKTLAQERHRGIDIEEGPVFSADICDLHGDQYLILVAHHLVIDLVSWRIILDDLKMLLESVEIEKAMPFRLWNDLQNEKAKSLLPASTLSTMGASNNLEFWSHDSMATHISNNLSDHDIMHINVDRETTSLLLGSANVAFNTEPVEILLASVWHSFLATFPDRESLTIFNEGHGRESWSTEIDLSRTIGWFTTLSPLHVTRSNSIATLVRTIKDSRRRLPYNGWAYFASRYLNDPGQIEFLSHNKEMELVFNYHGQFQLLEDEAALFQDINLEGVSEQGYSFPASSFFNIEVAIERGQICFDFSFNRHIAHQDRIKQWGHGISAALQEICHYLVHSKPSRTLCDFELLSLDYSALDAISNDILPQIESVNQCSVQDVLPCSPTVDGMLLSQLKQSDAYKTKQIYEVSSAEGESISVQAALEAWQKVIKHQPALRTVFINGQDSSSAFNQVVLSQHTGDVILLSVEDNSEALQKIQETPSVNYNLSKPPHRVIFCKTPDKLFWQLEMSHAITDGTSAAVLEQNFIDAYHGRDLTADMLPTMREYARVLSRTDRAAKASFWKKKLSNMMPCHFPRLSGVSHNADGRSEELTATLGGLQFSRIMQFCTSRMVTPASLLKSAWAFTLSAYTGRTSVCFGYLASGRDFDVPHLHESIGAYTNLMICRADITDDFSGEAFVLQLHDQLMEDLSYQHCSLANIQHDLGIGSDQQLFNSIVSYQRLAEPSPNHDNKSITLSSIDGDDPTEYEIGLGINHGSSSIELDLSYSPLYLTQSQAARVLSHMGSTVEAIIEGNQPLSLSSEDLHDIWSWNATVPETHEVCVHDLIAETAAKQPDYPAVCAWDGDFNYQELDTLATQLAHHLLELGLSTDSIVPHCIEKSKWASIATLAVMKAGGASVTLDVNQPFDRLESIVGQVTSPIIIASPGQVQLASRLHSGKMVVIGDSLLSSIAQRGRGPLPKVDPSCRLYINFTSGSTGVPKGVAITHSNYSSAIKHQQQAHFFKPTSRVFDFAYQSFDVSWSNFCHTFTIGACLCVPSEDERRNDAARAIRRMRVTHADMTPSAISTLPLETLSQLDTIVLGGEKLSPENARAWSAVTKVLNPYGPCECTPTSTITEVDASQAATGNITIGRGLGLNTWIVDVIKGDSLVPIGAVGELVLEGPLVGGYLGGDTNATAFITSASYLARGAIGHSGRSSRMYKTGDLVRYNVDGTLTFVGRKDGQVKINGQRVELGDIESHIECCLADSATTQVVAEIITPRAIGKPILVAFMLAAGEQSRNMEKDEFQDFVKEATHSLDERLASQLPPYMRPVAYIPILTVPMTATGKTDRRRLRELGGSLTRQDLAAAVGSELEYREPTGNMETGLQNLWATVLSVEPQVISANDNFLKLGGDSISAMRLVSVARENGFLITVASTLTSKTLADQALSLKKLSQADKPDTLVYEPFSLLPTTVSTQRDALYAQLYELGISSNSVEDIMPVTDHQCRCIALTHSAARNLLLYQTMDGSGAPNIGKLRATCAALVQQFDLLRTVFVPHNDTFLQVILKDIDVYVPVFTIRNDVTFDEQTEKIRMHDLTVQIPFGRPLTRISILHNVLQQKYRIIVRMSHAQHDGMSLVKMWDAFENMYNDSLSSPEPIVPRPEDVRKASFSNYMFALSRMDKEAAVEYWRRLLEGSTMTTVTKPTTYKLTYGEGPSVAVEIPRSTMEGSEFTFSTLLKSAWAYTLAQSTAEDDIVFGGLTHGRGLLGVDDVFGACVNIIPTRVKFRQNWTARDLVSHINDQQIASMRHETLGSRDIVRDCTNWATWTFAGTVVYHHNFEDSDSAEPERGMHVEESMDLSLGDLDMVDIHITSKAHKDCYRIELSFAPGLFSDSEAQKLSYQLRNTIILFHTALETPLSLPSETKLPAALHPPKERTQSLSAGEAPCTALKSRFDTKEVLHKAWSCTLNKPVESWSTKSLNFFDNGGDLVAASVLAAHLELKGYSLSVEDIVRYPDWNSQLIIIERS